MFLDRLAAAFPGWGVPLEQTATCWPSLYSWSRLYVPKRLHSASRVQAASCHRLVLRQHTELSVDLQRFSPQGAAIQARHISRCHWRNTIQLADRGCGGRPDAVGSSDSSSLKSWMGTDVRVTGCALLHGGHRGDRPRWLAVC